VKSFRDWPDSSSVTTNPREFARAGLVYAPMVRQVNISMHSFSKRGQRLILKDAYVANARQNFLIGNLKKESTPSKKLKMHMLLTNFLFRHPHRDKTLSGVCTMMMGEEPSNVPLWGSFIILTLILYSLYAATLAASPYQKHGNESSQVRKRLLIIDKSSTNIRNREL
jgi:hypothetical protein